MNGINKINNSIYETIALPVFRKIYSADLRACKLIFCINSGRSGSRYLTKLLGSAKEVESYHEPKPKMIGYYLKMINEQNYDNSFKQRRIKTIAIKNHLLNQMILKKNRPLDRTSVYSETSHMFIKTFFDVVTKDFDNIQVIILRRELARVLKSFVELGYFSAINKIWQDWMSSPSAVTAAIPTIDRESNLDQYDRCIAYLIDIEARARRFQQDYPDIKTHEVRLESLNNVTNVEKLFQELEVTPTQETLNVCGIKSNEKNKNKKKFNQSVDLEYCRERIKLYIEKAKSLGIDVPSTLALTSYE